MKFELGKFYQHSGGGLMHMIAIARNPIMWMGPTLIAESPSGELTPCGVDATSATNWREVTENRYMNQLSPEDTEPTGFKDEDGKAICVGDTIHFSYGIPPAGVDAPIISVDGEFFAITEGHNPPRSLLSELAEHVGQYWLVDNNIEKKS